MKLDAFRRNAGFTVVEMSVVLVVIAFIIVVLLSAQALTQKATAQTLIAEMSRYMGAIEHFQNKYKYLPGDLPDAGRYFTGDADTDGDGDGVWDTAQERRVVWPQLYQAGLIQQSVSAASGNAVPGVHRPESEVEGVGWTVLDELDIDPPGAVTSLLYYQVLRFGGAATDENLSRGMLKIADHQYIDTKVDQPNTPLTGEYIVGYVGTTMECARVDGSTYYYAEDDTVRCTGHRVKLHNTGTFTP